MTKGTWPEWAESWDGRRKCQKCGARLVIVQDYTGNLRHRICSRSGWAEEQCDAERQVQ